MSINLKGGRRFLFDLRPSTFDLLSSSGLSSFVVLAAVLGFHLVAMPAALAQEHDHEHDHAAHVQPTEAGPGDPALEAAIYDELVRPVVETYREELKTAADPAALRTPLRALLGKIHDTVAARLVDDVANRRTVAANVREKLLSSIEEIAATPAARAALHDLVDEALERDLSSRREYLWSAIMCWCPREKWTRTLSGCPDACADEQKAMVSAWISEGRTSEEVVELMVAHPRGGEKVRGYLKATGVNRLGYLLPFLFFGAAVLVLGVVLVRVTRGRDGPAVPTPVERDSRADNSTEEDDHWGELVEKELKEMDS